MKLFKQILFILIVFFKTETLFSDNEIFNVNNILLKKKDNITNKELADQAIKKGFDQLIAKILLIEDSEKLSGLNFSSIKELVTFYQTSKAFDEENNELVSFSVTFDKDKIHDLFFRRAVLYSVISDKDLFILPILIKNNEISIFNDNYFYQNWNKVYENELIEFILPIENIETIQNINKKKENLIDLDLTVLFKEYLNKNLALILIEENKLNNAKVYIKTKIQGKNISKSFNLNLEERLKTEQFYDKIIINSKIELINIVKSKNLIDVRTPSFLNVKFDLVKKNNFVELNSRIKKIDVIENVYVQEFNKNYMNLRIKYLGKLEKIISQLNKENINLELINDQWVIKIL